MSTASEQPDLSVDHTPAILPEVTITSAVEILPGHNYVIKADWDMSRLTIAVFENFQSRLKKMFPESEFVVIGRDQTVEYANVSVRKAVGDIAMEYRARTPDELLELMRKLDGSHHYPFPANQPDVLDEALAIIDREQNAGRSAEPDRT